MVLVDTSVWIDHLRNGNSYLQELLDSDEVACHPFIIGELACGNLKNRAEILNLLKFLPQINQAGHDEVMYFIETNRLMGRGLGYVDMNLLAYAVLADSLLWTLDKKLDETNKILKTNYNLHNEL